MTGHPYLIDVADREPRPFYDANATRIELKHLDVAHPDRCGEKVRIAELTAYGAAGDEPTVVDLHEDGARALAAALAAGFVRADPVDEV